MSMDTAEAADKFSSCKIVRMELFPVRVPFLSKFKIASGDPRSGVESMLVRLHTSCGVTGIGETQAWQRQGSSETIGSLKAVLEDHFFPRIVGRSPFDIARIMTDLDAAVWHSNYAQAPISDALLDIQGKLLGVPIYKLLGGRCRDKVGAGATIGIKQDISETIEEAQAFYDDGYRSFTVKVGNNPPHDAKAVEAVAEHFGDKIILRADGNSGMSFDQALYFVERIKHLPLDALEQLVPPWDIDGMADLARRFNIPFMADESVSSTHDLLTIIQRRAANAFQTKIAKNGGIWNCRKLWQLGDAAGLRIFPGNHPATSIVTMAAAHLATAWPGELLEGPIAVGIAGLIAEDVVTQPVKLEGRFLSVSEAPGLGLELDDAQVKKLRIDQ